MTHPTLDPRTPAFRDAVHPGINAREDGARGEGAWRSPTAGEGWRWRRPNGPAAAIALAALVSLIALLPLGFVAWIAVQTGWDTVAALVFRPRVGELLVNTLLLELATLPPAIILAVALAWLTERSDLPGARLWAWLAVAPLAVPAFVHSYAWITVAPGLHGLSGATLVSVLAYFPFLYVPVAAQMRRLDPAMEDVAASLGLGPWEVFLRVVLPQLRLPICGGALLVGLHLLAEYGLYVMIQFDTFTTAIVDQFQSAYNGPAANMLAGVLVLCCLALLGAETAVRGNERYARVGSGAARLPDRRRLGNATLPALLVPALTAALSLGVPLVTLGRWLLIGGAAVWGPAVLGAIGQTALLALAGAALTTLAALPMAWLSVRAPGRLQRIMEACHYHVGALPGVVVALALVTITVRVALPLYQTVATVLLAYGLLFLPRALVGLRGSIAQAPVELERAAMSLGRTPFQAVRQTTLRLAAPGAAASMAMVALGIANELTATLMLAPNGTRTLATEFWSFTAELDYAGAAPYAVLMVLASLPLTFLLHAQSKRAAGR
ncbi:ABC transporter permease [Azospirillum doebereinerae]|uniref:ABC transporter permease n=1 Tax=Azospirillum doebereinerae TaxID=92933 RepID=UPI001FD4B5EA|nr:iron ABC transporter permease [Azospirillum doebereinerae]